MVQIDFSKLVIQDLKGTILPQKKTNQDIGNGLYLQAKTFALADIARAIYDSATIDVSEANVKEFKDLVMSPAMRMIPVAMRCLVTFLNDAEKKSKEKKNTLKKEKNPKK